MLARSLPVRDGDLLLGQAEFAAQPFKGPRLLHRIQVFALEVFNNRDLHGLLVGDLADHGRDCRLASAS